MTLRQLEAISPSWVAPGCDTSRIAKDREELFDRQVVQVDVPLTCQEKQVILNLWTVEGTEALVFTGPEDWLPIYLYRGPLFFFDYEHLAGILFNLMPHQWAGGTDQFDDEFVESIDAMFVHLAALTAPPPPVAPPPPLVQPVSTSLNLV
jgi:hypothetical protein